VSTSKSIKDGKIHQAHIKPYGFELILDLHNCSVDTFNRKSIDLFFKHICAAIKMKRCKRYFWDDIGVPLEEQQFLPHTKGTSAVQFILTSTIVIHTLEILQSAYVNIFSCKKFDHKLAKNVTKDWFKAKECRSHFIERI
jgi:S-adenosylmethionine decarboxylase